MKLLLDMKVLSVNKAWKGRRRKTEDYKKYEIDVARMIGRCESGFTGPVQITYTFYMINHTMADNDNPVKPLQDILVKLGYIEDDRFVYRTILNKIPCDENYAEIEIKQMKIPNKKTSV